jgi:hypothetical protein
VRTETGALALGVFVLEELTAAAASVASEKLAADSIALIVSESCKIIFFLPIQIFPIYIIRECCRFNGSMVTHNVVNNI